MKYKITLYFCNGTVRIHYVGKSIPEMRRYIDKKHKDWERIRFRKYKDNKLLKDWSRSYDEDKAFLQKMRD